MTPELEARETSTSVHPIVTVILFSRIIRYLIGPDISDESEQTEQRDECGWTRCAYRGNRASSTSLMIGNDVAAVYISESTIIVEGVLEKKNDAARTLHAPTSRGSRK